MTTTTLLPTHVTRTRAPHTHPRTSHAPSPPQASRRVLKKAEVQKRRRAARTQFLYTLPLEPAPGQSLDVCYNPDATALRGRPEIYATIGFNRWGHPTRYVSQRMVPTLPGSIGFHRTTVQVPADAWTVDVVFSDSPAGAGGGSGFYDNNGGLDYHIPVAAAAGDSGGAGGGAVTRKGLHVVHIAVEMAPIAKVRTPTCAPPPLPPPPYGKLDRLYLCLYFSSSLPSLNPSAFSLSVPSERLHAPYSISGTAFDLDSIPSVLTTSRRPFDYNKASTTTISSTKLLHSTY